jgi:hypothetical protein
MKWRAVLARSEAAKRAGSKEINYSVATGRSGTSLPSIRTNLHLSGEEQVRRVGKGLANVGNRWWNLNAKEEAMWRWPCRFVL